MKTRNIKIRFISFAVSILMVLTLLPTAGLQAYSEPETPDYLTFTSEENNSSITVNLYQGSLEYSEDATNWEPIISGTSIHLDDGESVYLRGSENNNTQLFDYSKHIEITGKVACSGNIMTLLNYEHPDQAQMADSCYYYMFYGCTGLTEAPSLPATILADYCYANMFEECSGLTKAPSLPATTLAGYCYSNMFYGCTSLTEAPELSAKTLAEYCCYDMFSGCTNLTKAPELHATILAESCYNDMFFGCTELKEAPALPATTLADSCYANMFEECSGLTEAPVLPATTLADSCYSNMFYDCSSLTEAPELPATTLASFCYIDMFYGCSSLTKAPALPATTLADSCYSNMFENCTGLTEAPELPATTLAEFCYYDMFYGCSSLTEAPALPATNLEYSCYSNMFGDCTSLTEIPTLPATTLAESCYNYMFFGCTGIKLSATQTEDYTIEYRVPASGEGTISDNALTNMFMNTGGIFTGTPDINTIYYMKKVESTALADGEFKQTAKSMDKYYTRFVFVVPKSNFEGKGKAKFTAHYNGIDYSFDTNTYYTGVISNGITYTPESEESAIFVVTVSSSFDISADLTCTLDFE